MVSGMWGFRVDVVGSDAVEELLVLRRRVGLFDQATSPLMSVVWMLPRTRYIDRFMEDQAAGWVPLYSRSDSQRLAEGDSNTAATERIASE